MDKLAARLPAVFGGTFDPFHEGHRQLLLKTVDRFKFSPYIIVPSGQPPHKGQPRSSDQDRVALIQNALGPDTRFLISDVEVTRPGPHYAIDTLRLLKVQYAPASELVYVQGSDSIQTLAQWKNPEDLLREFLILVVQRKGFPHFELTPLMLPYRERIFWVDLDLPELSSSRLRGI